MRDDSNSFFTAEELRAFREVDQQRVLEQEADVVVSVDRSVSPVTAPTMSPEQSRGWNAWASELIARKLTRTAGALGAEVGKIERGLRQELKAITTDLAVLRAENVELRVQLSYLRGAADHDRGRHETLDLPALPKRSALNG
jgi:hypothetical protein